MDHISLVYNWYFLLGNIVFVELTEVVNFDFYNIDLWGHFKDRIVLWNLTFQILYKPSNMLTLNMHNELFVLVTDYWGLQFVLLAFVFQTSLLLFFNINLSSEKIFLMPFKAQPNIKGCLFYFTENKAKRINNSQTYWFLILFIIYIFPFIA